MRLRMLALALISSALVVGLGLFWLDGQERSRAAEPVSESPARDVLASTALEESTPSGTLAPAALPAAESDRRALSTSPAGETDEAAEEPGGGTAIVGRVVDEAGRSVAGAGVRVVDSLPPGVFVSLSRPAAPEASTDAEGAFRLTLERPGATRIEVGAAGFAPALVDGIAAAAGSDTALDDAVVLERSATVQGVVLDDTGAPLANALVGWREGERDVFGSSSPRENALRTGPDGTFRLDRLPRRMLTLRVTQASFLEHEQLFDARRPVELPLVTISMARGSTIEGRLVGIPSDLAEHLVVVTRLQRLFLGGELELRQARVDPEGFFRLEGLPEGSSWMVFARKLPEGHDPRRPGAEHALANDRERVSDVVPARAGREELVLTWEEPAVLLFQVVDASTRKPIEMLTLKTRIGKATLSQGLTRFADGKVRLARLPAGRAGERQVLEVDAPGYAAWSKRDLALVPGRETDLGIIALPPAPRLSITVLDDRDGTPVKGARASLSRAAAAQPQGAGVKFQGPRTLGTGRTDAEGRCVFDGVDGSTVDLSITADGFARAHIAGWALPGGVDSERTVRLVQGGAVRITALDREGRPLGGRTIEHRAPGERATGDRQGVAAFGSTGATHVTDAEGHVLFEHSSPGEHAFRVAGVDPAAEALRREFAAADDGEEAGWSTVEVVAGHTVELELFEALRASLTGRVTAGGRPLKDAGVSLRLKREAQPGTVEAFRAAAMKLRGENGPEVRTDRDGRFRVEGIVPDDYVLRIVHQERAMPFQHALTLDAGETQRDFDLGVAIITGRVVDAGGVGVEGVVVSVERESVPGALDALSLMARSMPRAKRSGATLGSAVTDATGAYELRGVATDVEVFVAADGSSVGLQSGRSGPLIVAADELVRGVDIELERAGSLDFRILRPGGTIPDLVQLQLRRADASADVPARREFLRAGTGLVHGLAPGTWHVLARGSAFAEYDNVAERAIDVVVGETLLVELQLP
ncbi:MAG: carboxypeptidase-like regulatory domain-containing protein [Planctomycetota bacterium]